MNGDVIRMRVRPADGSEVEVDAVPTETPGLCVVPAIGSPGFTIVQFGSGLATLQHLPSMALAQAAAVLLGDVADWEQSGKEIQEQREQIDRRIAAHPELVKLVSRFWINSLADTKAADLNSAADTARIL